MEKSLASSLVLVAVLAAAPLSSFAQSSGVTRAQVRAELVQLEKAGYNPVANDINYPADVQAAEARVHASQPVAQNGSLRQVSEADQSGPGSVYFGH